MTCVIPIVQNALVRNSLLPLAVLRVNTTGLLMVNATGVLFVNATGVLIGNGLGVLPINAYCSVTCLCHRSVIC